jgi:hypothetical protein
MKFAIMIYGNPATWVHPMFLHQHKPLAPADREAQINEFTTLVKEISGSGELVDSAALDDPRAGRTIRMRNGVLITVNEPFTDAKEQLAGFFIVDCETAERAVGIEVRPVMDLSGMEM